MFKSSIIIREAKKEDAEKLAEFIVEYKREQGEQIIGTQVRARVQALLFVSEGNDSHSVLLVNSGEQLLGYAVVHWVPFFLLGGVEGYVSEFFISSFCRGEGLGGRLLQQVESIAQGRGCFRLMLNNRKDAESFKREFYEKQGFKRRDDFGNFVKELRSR